MELKIGGVAYRHSVPATVSRTLDESLDSAHVVIPYTDRKEPFTPFSFAELDGERWLVGADMPAEVKGLRGKWKHDVTLVEETKRMETMFVSAKTITKHDYKDFVEAVHTKDYVIVSVHDPSASGYQSGDITATDFVGTASITNKTQLLFSSQAVRGKEDYTEDELHTLAEAVNTYSSKPYFVWVESGGSVRYHTDSPTDPLNVLAPFSEIGNNVEIHYFMGQTQDAPGNPMIFYELKYEVIPSVLVERTENKTAREIVEDLIADAEQLRHGDTPRIHLSADEAARLDLIEAPEDAFSEGMTLFEALLKVGDWDGVGGIPKLQRDVLTFERWGSTETVEIDGRVVAVQDAATAEDYCSTLETQAANMIDEIGKPVTDPFVGGYQTVRTDDGAVVIEDGTICISTAFPIWQVTKLTLGYVGGKIQQQGGDITPYVYERTEYDLLSDFTRGGFPESKAYALYYTKGAPGINGLSFIPRTFSGDMGWMQYNAIEHILQAKFGIKPRLTSADIVNLMFRVEYVPYISTRVRQHKTATNGIEAAMAYGQGGAVISARTYGGHLRARAQMLGLPEKSMQVVFSPSATLPAPGQRIDSTNYIGSVVTEYYPTYRKSQITMSPNYNRINRFVDIKKDLRQFEIPMEGSTDRNVIHEDYIVIGEREGKFPTMMSDAMQSATMTALMGGGTDVEINAAVLTTSNKADKTDGSQVILPLVKTAVGNSVLFYVKYKNNYSAGTVSDDSPRVGESSRLQRDVRYTDAYGNAKYLHMDLMTGASIRAGDIQTAHSIPLTGGVELGRSVISTADKPILLNKDARESIALTYQIHYVSNTDIIIGQEMAARAPWISSVERSTPKVYTYRSPINPLTGEATEADRGGKEISTGVHLNVRYAQMPTVGDHVAWAVKQDGVFLFGANSKMPDRVYFNFRDKLAEVTGGAAEETIENVFVTLNTANVSFVNKADYTPKGGTYTNNFKARDSYVLPKNITVKMGGTNITNYTWNRTTGALEVPNVTDDLEITVFGENNAHTVIVEFEFWDQYGNDLLYTEKSYGVYPYGFKVVVPNIIEHAHDEEMRQFESQRDTYTVTVTEDMNIYQAYYLKVYGTPKMYDVYIRLEYWDEWENDHRFDEVISAPYMGGTKITIPGTVEKNDKTYLLNGTGEDINLIVRSNITTYFIYKERSTQRFNVHTKIDFWDKYGNDLLFTEEKDTKYDYGMEIVLPAKIYRVLDEEERAFISGKDTYSVTVDRDMVILEDYYLETYDPGSNPSSKKYTVILTFEFWDEYQNDHQFNEGKTRDYLAGYVMTIPGVVERNGKTYLLNGNGEDIKIIVNYDITDTYIYTEKPTTKHSVTVQLDLWDEYGNDLLKSEDHTTTYDWGSEIVIPKEIYRTIDEEVRYFVSDRDTYTVVVDRDMRIRQSYYLSTPKTYMVNITLEYWDEYENDHRFDEKIIGGYYDGHRLTIPGTVERNDKTYLLNGTGEDVIVMVYSDIKQTYVYTEKPTEKYKITTELTFWDKWGNQQLFAEKKSAVYQYGMKISFPENIYRVIDGETRTFTSGKPSYTVTVRGNRTISEDYYIVDYEPIPPDEPDEPDEPVIPPDTTEEYSVNITLEYWDEYQNDHRFDETISGTYNGGDVITIPGVVERNERTYLLEGSGNDIVITVTEDIDTYYVYSEQPTQKYNVYIEYEFWDEYGNQLLFTDEQSGIYDYGSQIDIPAVAYRMYNEEMRAFDLQGSAKTIVVSGTVQESFAYQLRP